MKKELSNDLFINRFGNLEKEVGYGLYVILDGWCDNGIFRSINHPGPLDFLIKMDGWKDVYFTTLKNS